MVRAGELKQLKPPSALRGTNRFPPSYPIRQPDKQDDEKPQETQRFLVHSPAYSHCIISGQKIEIRSAPGKRLRRQDRGGERWWWYMYCTVAVARQ